MGKKATEAETEARVNEVMTMIAMGTARPEILQYAAKNWDISTRTTDTLATKARRRFAQMSNFDRDEMRGLALARYTWALYTAAKALDLQRFIAAQTRIDNLFALETPKTLKVVAELLTPADAALLAELLKLFDTLHWQPGETFAAMIEQAAAMKQIADGQADDPDA